VTWSPVLQGDLADRASSTIEELATVLAPVGLAGRADASWAGGSAGIATLFTHLASTGHQAAQARANDHIESAIQGLSAVPMLPSLLAGFTGVAWATLYLQDTFDGGRDPEYTAELDEALLEHVSRSPYRREYDLVSGLAGFGLYAAYRGDDYGRALAGQVVARLDELAEHSDAGVTWFTPPRFLPAHQLETWPDGYHNLGLAHGMPAAVGFLAQAAAMGNDHARQLAEESVRWLVSKRLPGGDYTAMVDDGPSPKPSRLAWCYGNPGVASALLVAGQVLGREEWRQVAIDIGRCSAARPDEDAGVLDAGLCHGAGGLALIYNHLFQASGDHTLRTASAHWYEKLLDMRRPGVGIGGFQAWEPPDWVDDPGVLTGAAGIALALHAATTDVPPTWDAVLLMSPAFSG
jgi:hypothetical protein